MKTTKWEMRIARLVTMAGIAASVFFPAAHAADNFSVSVTSEGSSASRGFSSIESALNQLQNNQLNAILPNYTQTSIASSTINLRGLSATAGYQTTGTALNFTIPSLGVNQTFQGATRDESQKQLLDFLKKGNFTGRLLNAFAGVSPTEPIAGNPSSLMSQMAGRDFDVAFSGNGSGVGIGIAYSQLTQGGVPVSLYTLPINYIYAFDSTPGYALTFDLPISYRSAGGAAGGSAVSGISLSIPIAENWTVTPKLSLGATGSLDLGSVGALAAGTIVSSYRFKLGGYDLVLGNLLGVARTLPLSFGQYSVDPKLTNEFTKNGLMVSHDLKFLGIDQEWMEGTLGQVWAIDTRFVGSKLYDDNYQEFGVAVGRSFAFARGKFIRLGISYLHSHHSQGATFNLGYKF